ncbi:MAG TPA: ABC transporter permease [Acidimicrobiales bacterium]|nr:ABC transporter permease [Acidimicrobiales bacterium]
MIDETVASDLAPGVLHTSTTAGEAAAPPSRTRELPTWVRPKMWLPPLVAMALLAVAWQLYAIHNPYVIPKLQEIFGNLGNRPGFYFHNALTTLQEAAVGAGVGMGIAFVLAIVMSYVRIVERAVLPLAVVLNVTPIIAVAPALVVAFGFGMMPKYIITSVLVFFPFLINSLIGLRSVDPLALDLMKTLHASRSEILWKLRLPSSLPFLFAAARICAPLSIIGAVVAEFVAAGQTNGLGVLIVTAASLGDLKTIYASVVVLAVMGIAVFLLVVFVQSRMLTWHSSSTVKE